MDSWQENDYWPRASSDIIEPGRGTGALHARERGLSDIVKSSIVDLKIRDSSVGAIGLFDVLEHVEDESAALMRLRDMLAENGRLYLTVPAHKWLWSSVDVEAGHFRRYTRGKLCRLLRNAGFDIEFASYYFWPLPVPMLALRCLPERARPAQGGKPLAACGAGAPQCWKPHEPGTRIRIAPL